MVIRNHTKQRRDIALHLTSASIPAARRSQVVGFEAMEYLHTAFRRAYGMTPRQYRQREAARG